MALSSTLFAISKLAPMTNMTNHISAAIAHPTCIPPMWKTFAHMHRILRGTHVGTDEKTLNNRLMTGSDRIKIAAQRFAAVAFATAESGYVCCLMLS